MQWNQLGIVTGQLVTRHDRIILSSLKFSASVHSKPDLSSVFMVCLVTQSIVTAVSNDKHVCDTGHIWQPSWPASQ